MISNRLTLDDKQTHRHNEQHSLYYKLLTTYPA